MLPPRKTFLPAKQRPGASGMRTSRLVKRSARERITKYSRKIQEHYIYVGENLRISTGIQGSPKCKGVSDLRTKMCLKIEGVEARNRKLAHSCHELELRQTRAMNCAGH